SRLVRCVAMGVVAFALAAAAGVADVVVTTSSSSMQRVSGGAGRALWSGVAAAGRAGVACAAKAAQAEAMQNAMAAAPAGFPVCGLGIITRHWSANDVRAMAGKPGESPRSFQSERPNAGVRSET